MALAQGSAKNDWLTRSAAALRDRAGEIFEANARDVAAAPGLGLNAAAIDRLSLNPRRIDELAGSLLQVARSPGSHRRGHHRRPASQRARREPGTSSAGRHLHDLREPTERDRGCRCACVKSGDAVILRGGKEAIHSNRALHRILADELQASGLPEHAVQLVPTIDRAAVGLLLGMPEFIDLAIPRGGGSLIRRVVAEARMPVMKHYQGICVVYVDAAADFKMAIRITLNAKVQRPGVCNAVETLLVHSQIAPEFLPEAAAALAAAGVELRGDEHARSIVPAMNPAQPEDWDTEFLDKILAVKVVGSIAEAIEHIGTHGSGHTDCIVTSDLAAARRFVAAVDSSAVMVNASTRFNDGGQLGLGAEIGISTDKYHARGPCGLRELTSTKWIVIGDGQVRE